jgi:hypothetical protein
MCVGFGGGSGGEEHSAPMAMRMRRRETLQKEQGRGTGPARRAHNGTHQPTEQERRWVALHARRRGRPANSDEGSGKGRTPLACACCVLRCLLVLVRPRDRDNQTQRAGRNDTDTQDGNQNTTPLSTTPHTMLIFPCPSVSQVFRDRNLSGSVGPSPVRRARSSPVGAQCVVVAVHHLSPCRRNR